MATQFHDVDRVEGYYGDYPLTTIHLHRPLEEGSILKILKYLDEFMKEEEHHRKVCTKDCNVLQRCGGFVMLADVVSRFRTSMFSTEGVS